MEDINYKERYEKLVEKLTEFKKRYDKEYTAMHKPVWPDETNAIEGIEKFRNEVFNCAACFGMKTILGYILNTTIPDIEGKTDAKWQAWKASIKGHIDK